jgi:predicted alpha-1,2-mannosidase
MVCSLKARRSTFRRIKARFGPSRTRPIPGRRDPRPAFSLLAASLVLMSFTTLLSAQVANHVDPLIGTGSDGNTLIGPSLPFGMIKPGPDVGRNDSNSGWQSTGQINGFSQTHVSGTGGGPKYGNVLVQPTVGDPQSTAYGSSRKNERSSIGFYGVTLDRYPVAVEVTAARRTALYRFTYPAAQQVNILFDMGHCLTRYRLQFPHLGSFRDSTETMVDQLISKYYKTSEAQFVTGSSIHVVSPTEVSGSTSVTGGWNKQSTSYTVFFYAITNTPAMQSGTWQGSTMHPSGKNESAGNGGKTGAWLTFSTHTNQQVLMKVGISFVSSEQAKQNALSEIPGFDFEQVHAQAVATWEAALGKVELKGATADQARMFYTSLYHTMLMPVDRTGENPLWQSKEPYYDDYYAIWDTFRTSNPLLTLIAQDRESGIVRSLVDIYRHEGWLPDARSGNYTGLTQGGSNAEMVIGDAYVKHLPGIDWAAAYQGMVKDAEVSPPDQMREGRGGLDDWKTLKYVSIQGVDRPGSKQMEYAADDYEIALVARGFGNKADYDKYFARSGNWRSLWDASYQEGGVTGFIRPKNRDGSWLKDFNAMQHCSWGGNSFYEGNSWTYSTFVPQDVKGLIQQSGGNNAFVQRLDALFTGAGRYDVSNEPGFLSPYLYIWAGRYDKTAERVRTILAQNYHPKPDGLPGNDDSGAISSWYAFGAMGIFPVAGQDVYVIGSPSLPEVTLHLAGDKTFVIEARNVSAANLYVLGAKLNGKPLNQAWLRHQDIEGGGKLSLIMGPKPGGWPSGDAPPSSSDLH